MLDETSGVHAEMWKIRSRHEAGTSTVQDWRRYRGCWQALALRRSVAQRTYLPLEVDDLLAERMQMLAEIQAERALRVLEGAFAVSMQTRAHPA